jgi:hypothetical protein
MSMERYSGVARKARQEGHERLPHAVEVDFGKSLGLFQLLFIRDRILAGKPARPKDVHYSSHDGPMGEFGSRKLVPEVRVGRQTG